MSILTWLNGEILEGGVFPISASSQTLQFGRGLFETIALRSGELVCWDLHLRRLMRGCESLGFEGLDRTSLTSEVRSILGARKVEEGRLKLTIFDDGISNRASRLLTLSPLPDPPPYPISAFIAEVVRSDPPTGVRLKSTSYLDEWIVQRTASERGMFDGIMVRYDGVLVEGSRTNVFFEVNGSIHTPAVSSGLLPGTGREAILTGAEECGLSITTGLFDVDLLRNASAIALVSSLRGVMPLGVLRDESAGWEEVYPTVPRFIAQLSEAFAIGVERTSVAL